MSGKFFNYNILYSDLIPHLIYEFLTAATAERRAADVQVNNESRWYNFKARAPGALTV